jgi:hypothetical protein
MRSIIQPISLVLTLFGSSILINKLCRFSDRPHNGEQRRKRNRRRIVQAIGPHTESDEAALLVHLLVMLGIFLSRNAYYFVAWPRRKLYFFSDMIGYWLYLENRARWHMAFGSSQIDACAQEVPKPTAPEHSSALRKTRGQS